MSRDWALFSRLRKVAGWTNWPLTGICLAANIILGLLVVGLRLPFLYLDSVGTILATAVAGRRSGLVCGIGFTVISSPWISHSWMYAGTVIGIVLFTETGKRYGFMRTWRATIACAPVLAVVCAFLSAPVSTFVLRISPPDGLSRYLAVRTTNTDKIVLAGLLVELLDKTLSSIVALGLRRLMIGGRRRAREMALERFSSETESAASAVRRGRG